MIETVINYRPEYRTDANGRRILYRYDTARDTHVRDADGALIEDPGGRPFRQWRAHIRTPEDIWEEIVAAGALPGTTSAPMLQPIITRIVMLQSGMRAPMGVKVKGADLDTIEAVGLEVERLLREVPGVSAASVYAERIVGKPYLEIDIHRDAIARHGLQVRQVQDVIEVAVGGIPVTTTVEGRERYPVRVRYPRELRDDVESLERILVPAPGGLQVPLGQLATVRYVRGPQMIKSEDTFLIGYVTFDKEPGFAEVDVVERCKAHLDAAMASGALRVPPGVSLTFAGTYENQVHAARTLTLVLPLSLFIIFVILYLQFRDTITTGLVFLGTLVAWSGGFAMLWFYAQPWFLDFEIAGENMRTLFQAKPVLLSVAIWVGFLALFGIASDDGVVMASYLKQNFSDRAPRGAAEIRAAVLEAGQRRIRPCLMTTATTILALLPVLTATGRGSDVMIPMAIPTVGGMAIELMTLFLVPVLFCAREEARWRWNQWRGRAQAGS
jgi:Cu(I)/Ag(I) efflux system membrane protein CusA/SilA